MTVIFLTLFGVLTVGLTACSSPQSAPSTADTPTATTPGSTSGAPSSGSPGPSAGPSPGSGTAGSGQIATGSPITITRSGGIAGYQQILKISSDGSWVLSDKRTDTTQRGTMTAAQRQELSRLLADPSFPREARQPPAVGTCNDGIVYTVTVGELSSRYDQCGGSTARPTTAKIVNVAIDATAM